MAQKPKVLVVTITSGGTPQRVVPEATAAADRFVKSIYFEAKHDNTDFIYIGDADLSSSQYSTALAAAQGIDFRGDEVRGVGSVFANTIDLAQVWVDGTTGEKVMVTYPQES